VEVAEEVVVVAAALPAVEGKRVVVGAWAVAGASGEVLEVVAS
jgi:hypothetical protein